MRFCRNTVRDQLCRTLICWGQLFYLFQLGHPSTHGWTDCKCETSSLLPHSALLTLRNLFVYLLFFLVVLVLWNNLLTVSHVSLSDYSPVINEWYTGQFADIFIDTQILTWSQGNYASLLSEHSFLNLSHKLGKLGMCSAAVKDLEVKRGLIFLMEKCPFIYIISGLMLHVVKVSLTSRSVP